MTPPRPTFRTAGRGPGRGLTPAIVVDAAIGLIERHGPDALSMRRLAAELGVDPMSLYNHVDGRDGLLVAIGERMLEPLCRLDLDGDWREACRRFAADLRAIALARPATFRLVGMQPLDSATSLRAVEHLLGALVDQGLSAVEALVAYRAVVSYARGYALAEAVGFTVDAARAPGRKRLRSLAPDAFPVLAGCVGELSELDADAGFERGLRALLSGLPDPGSR